MVYISFKEFHSREFPSSPSKGVYMEKHTKLNTHFKGYLVGKGYVRATKALNLMKNQFSGRVRKDGVTPVYAHSLEIAAQLRTYTFPPQVSEEDVLIVALLHDILEDTDYMSVDIQSTYGANILDAVRLLTKASDYDNRIYYANILMNILAVIVKCMDRIHNLDQRARSPYDFGSKRRIPRTGSIP
jgi:(p)ppGpp synthase/HD superfamily hydrolase